MRKNMKLQCSLAAVALCAGVSHADLTDTFTAGIAAIAVDPNDPIGSLDFGNANVIAGASSLIPGFSPMVGGGPTALFDPIANEGAGGVSPITVQANTDLIGDLMTIDITWSTSNGSQIFSNVNPAFFILPDGANATHIVLDTGNYFGAGGAMFPRDGIDIGSAWSFVSGTVTAQLPDETDVDPLQWFGDSFLPPDITDIYHAGFIPIQYGFHDIWDATSIEYSITVQIPAPGAAALLCLVGLGSRRRRD